MKTTSINFQLPEAWPWHERYGTWCRFPGLGNNSCQIRLSSFITTFDQLSLKTPEGQLFIHFLSADAIIGISDDNVFVPQETDFANNIARAVVDTFPAGSTRSGVHPYVWSMDTL